MALAGVLESLRRELDRPKQPRTPAVEPVKPVPVEIREVTHPFASLESILSLLVHPLTPLGIVVLMLAFFVISCEDLRNRLMPPDAVQPGKFPDDLAEGAGFVCLCWLAAPTEARSMLARQNAFALLPSKLPDAATDAPQSTPAPAVATR